MKTYELQHEIRQILDLAINKNLQVTIEYFSLKNEISERIISEIQYTDKYEDFGYYEDHITAYCHLRKEQRDFRIDRIRSIKILDDTLVDASLDVNDTPPTTPHATENENESNYAETERSYTCSLNIMEQALGPDHPSVAAWLNKLGSLHKTHSNYAKAEPPYKRSLLIMEKAFGPDNPTVATCLNNLALLYKMMEDYAKAELLYKRSLTILEKTFDENNKNVKICKENIQKLYATQLKKSKNNYQDIKINIQKSITNNSQAIIKYLDPNNEVTERLISNIYIEDEFDKFICSGEQIKAYCHRQNDIKYFIINRILSFKVVDYKSKIEDSIPAINESGRTSTTEHNLLSAQNAISSEPERRTSKPAPIIADNSFENNSRNNFTTLIWVCVGAIFLIWIFSIKKNDTNTNRNLNIPISSQDKSTSQRLTTEQHNTSISRSRSVSSNALTSSTPNKNNAQYAKEFQQLPSDRDYNPTSSVNAKTVFSQPESQIRTKEQQRSSIHSAVNKATPTNLSFEEQSKYDSAQRLAQLGYNIDWQTNSLTDLLDAEGRIGAANRLAQLGYNVDWRTNSLTDMLNAEARIGAAYRLKQKGISVNWQNYTLTQLLSMEYGQN